MNTFTWLFISHLVGDWLLQNHWMATGKRQGWLTLAGQTHFIIYTFIVMIGLWLSGVRNEPLLFYLGLGAVIFLSHWLVDASNGVERWMRLLHQSNLPIVRIMVDQTLHLLVLTGLTVFCSKL
jgi:hypothetical protein